MREGVIDRPSEENKPSAPETLRKFDSSSKEEKKWHSTYQNKNKQTEKQKEKKSFLGLWSTQFSQTGITLRLILIYGVLLCRKSDLHVA